MSAPDQNAVEISGLPDRLTQDELACHWRKSARTLERWRVAGIGPAWLKLPGRVLYRREDVLAYEASHTVLGEETP